MCVTPNHIITSGNHSFDAFKKMKSLRENSSLCDVNIKVGDTIIPAHRVVLASCSPYFEFMFTGKVAENGKTEIHLKDLCPETVSPLIDYIYSGFLVVNDKTIVQILKAADFLQITSAKEECLKFLQKNINAVNCISFRNLAKKHYFIELEHKVNYYIRWNFLEVIQSEAFLKFTLDEVKDFLSDSSFCLIRSNLQEAVSAWIQYDKTSRESFKNELLTNVTGISESLNQGNLNLYDAHRQKRIYIFSEAVNYNDVVFFDLNTSTLHDAPLRPSMDKFSCVTSKNSIFLIDTFKGQTCKYDVENEQWTTTDMETCGGFYSRACNVQNNVFIIADGSSKKTFSLDLEKNVLCRKPSLIYERTYPGVALNGHCVYVCGGECRSSERLDVRTKMWRSIARISSSTLGRCSAASLDDFIYCASVHQTLFYKYDPRNGQWTAEASIPNSGSNSYTSISSTDDTLYAVNKKGIYKFNESQASWTTIPCALYTNSSPPYTTSLCFTPE